MTLHLAFLVVFATTGLALGRYDAQNRYVNYQQGKQLTYEQKEIVYKAGQKLMAETSGQRRSYSGIMSMFR